MILRFQSVVALVTCWCMVYTTSASTSAIGMVMTTGTVEINGSSAPGSAAIFSGSRISSGDRSSNIQFSDGSRAMMRPGATMTVYREHSVLQQGVALQRGIDKHPVVAGDLRILGATPNAVALVSVRDASHFEVAAAEGEADVLTPSGGLLARVEPGTALAFTIVQTAGEAQQISPSICGDLQQNHQVTDALTQVTYQLQGAGLDRYVGKSIRVTGTVQSAPPGSASQIFIVSSVRKLNQPGVAGPGAAPAVTGTVLAISQTKAVLLGLAALGGLLIGLAATVGFGPSGNEATPAIP